MFAVEKEHEEDWIDGDDSEQVSIASYPQADNNEWIASIDAAGLFERRAIREGVRLSLRRSPVSLSKNIMCC